jgi:hypothetical protein
LLALTASAQEHEGPWKRHTIDDSSKGADGVRLADANDDGLMDIATGWEEGGIVRLYLNPGPEKSKEKWPAVTVGPAKSVEDAVMVDLDGDGAMDIVSSCEGKTKTMFVHWGPKDKAKLLDEDAWVTEAIPATVGKQMWMYCLPIQVDSRRGIDLVTGSKGKGAAVGWLESPEDPRDLKAWRYEKIEDAGWIMTIQRSPINHPPWLKGEANLFPPKQRDYEPVYEQVLISDRKGDKDHRVYKLHFPIQENGGLTIPLCPPAEYMFACDSEIHLGDRYFNLFSATRNGKIWYEGSVNDPLFFPNPFGVKHGKAIKAGKIDIDAHMDLVHTANTQGEKGKPGVAWIKLIPGVDPKDWPAYDISGLEGKKFDRLELIDLDGDGDLDVLTCEEADNLGVIWYENPYGKAEDQ